MKAKDYVARFDLAENKKEILTEILMDFYKESVELCKNRHVKYSEGLFGIFRELDQKFKSFSRQVKTAKIKETGFRDLLKVLKPEIYEYIKW